MTRFMLTLVLAFFCLGGNAWADETKESCVTVQRGDNLIRTARALNSTVSDLARINGIKNPNRIYLRQKICRDAEMKSPAKGSEIPQKEEPEKPSAPKNVETDIAVEGYTPYAEVGRNPLVPKNEQNPKALTSIERDALVHIGANEGDIALIDQLLKEGKMEAILLPIGTKFIAMSERGKGKSVKISHRRIATWKSPESATVFTLSDGRKVARIDSCSNWTQLEVEPEETPEEIALAAVTPEPIEEAEEERGCGLDDHDLFLSRGGTSGNGSSTTYNYADGFACLAKTRVDGGTVKGGVGGLYGDHHGSADDGFGYKGKRYGGGPAVKYVDDDGWDARLGLLFGRVSNDGHSADRDYVQSRNFRMFGPSAGINLYQREMAGEAWFPKTQIWASAFKLSGASLNHSWQGTPIEDTSSLKSSWLISAGVRQFILQGPVKPWVSAEFFGELPMTRNGTLMIGVTDEKEIFWAGIGKTWSLKNGGSAQSWMFGMDVGNAVRERRSDARHEEWVNTRTSYYDPQTGAFTTKKSEGNEVSPSTVARFDTSGGKFVSANSQTRPEVPTPQDSATPSPELKNEIQRMKQNASLTNQDSQFTQEEDHWANHWNG
jgi:hypothetical protein